MDAISVRLPDELKDKAIRLAKKKNMSLSFNSLMTHSLQATILRDETRMESNLKGKSSDLAIAKFGSFLKKTQRGDEPTLDEIQRAMKG